MEEALLKSHSCSIHGSCSNASEAKGAYRFLLNENVTEETLISELEERCSLQAKKKDLLVFCDTTSFNFDDHLNRIQDTAGLGSIGSVNGYNPTGFFCHPQLVHDQHTGMPIGISDVQLWSRLKIAKRPKSRRYETKDIPIEHKETYRWLGPCLKSREGVLSEANHLTYVMDREGDIMEIYDRIPDERTSVLVRAKHNRNVITPNGEKLKLNDFVDSQPVAFNTKIKIKSRKRKHRVAKVEVKYAHCKIIWHDRQKVLYRNNEKGVNITIIQVKEKRHRGYKDEPELIWRLISTDNIENDDEVKEQIRIYEQRWRVEEFFKLLKSDGFNIESSELTTGKAIRKLLIIIMKASIRIQQLKAARAGDTSMEVSEVFSPEEIECLEKINEKVSGQTEKQKNPYNPKNLGWATWIIARLGGWKQFYNKARPPGNKTLVWGLEKFEAIMVGYNIFKNQDVS